MSFRKMSVFLMALLVVLACSSGCGMAGDADDGLPEGVADAEKATSAAAGAVTAVYLTKDSMRLGYLVDGRPVSEAELMAAMRDLGEDAPEAVIAVIATAGVSSDEANYVAAKIRGKGIENVTVSSTAE